MKLKKYLLSEMMKKVPEAGEFVTDEEILRFGIQAELDAVNLYQFLARKTKNINVKKVLLDIAKEEKTHIHEFEELLEMIDKEYHSEEDNAEKELKDIGIGGIEWKLTKNI